MHSDVSLAGVAKGFGVRLVRFHALLLLILYGTTLLFFALLYKFDWQAPDEEFEEFLRQQAGELCPGDKNEVDFGPFQLIAVTNAKTHFVEVMELYIFVNVDGKVA